MSAGEKPRKNDKHNIPVICLGNKHTAILKRDWLKNDKQHGSITMGESFMCHCGWRYMDRREAWLRKINWK